MPQLSKQDIKEIFTETLEPFAKAVQSDFSKVNGRFDKVEFDLSEVKKDVKWMKDNSSELFTKLDKLISFYEKHDQELLILSSQLQRLEERVVKLESK